MTSGSGAMVATAMRVLNAVRMSLRRNPAC